MSSERMRLVDSEELRRLVPMAEAIDALEDAFARLDPSGAASPRSRMETATGSLLLMPAHGEQGVGVKLVTLSPDNPEAGFPFVQAAYVLFDAETQAPQAVIDGTALTTLRTAAVSGLATKWMAREEANRLVIFGSGVQARSHLEAMCVVRPVGSVVIVSREGSHAAAFADDARTGDLHVHVGTPADVESADLICTCTNSNGPLFEGKKLPLGVHVNAIGSFRPETREIDTATVVRSRLVVETRASALAEAGDLLMPIAEGAITPDHMIADLTELIHGAEVRRSKEDITVFKSVGISFEDLVIARAVVDAG